MGLAGRLYTLILKQFNQYKLLKHLYVLCINTNWAGKENNDMWP